jgi:hypothetical protein
MNEEKEIDLLLEILKGDGDPKPEPGSFSSDRLIRLAEMHKVVYHLNGFARKYPEGFTQEQLDGLDDHCRQAALRSLTQLHELKRIATVLQEHKLNFAVIKGPQLSRMLYGREALKESVDLDIMLVNRHDFRRAHHVLKESGYTWSELDSLQKGLSRKIFLGANREVHYISPGTQNHIDLHIKPGANTYLTQRYFRNFFSDLTRYDLDGVELQVPGPEKYLAYLCYHGSLHQFSRLAWLSDIRAYLQQNKDSLDYSRLLMNARSWHAERGVFIAIRLLQEYFGDEVPDELLVPRSLTGRVGWLSRGCRSLLEKDAEYQLSIKGRIRKFMYRILLIRGFDGKLDFVYGIVMRMLARKLKKQRSARPAGSPQVA